MAQQLPRVTSDMVSRRPDQTSLWLNRLAQRVDTLEKTTTKSSSTSTLPIATQYTLGGVKVGTNLSITPEGVLSAQATGTSDYNALTNQPQINAVTLSGNKSLPDLDINRVTNWDIENLINW